MDDKKFDPESLKQALFHLNLAAQYVQSLLPDTPNSTSDAILLAGAKEEQLGQLLAELAEVAHRYSCQSCRDVAYGHKTEEEVIDDTWAEMPDEVVRAMSPQGEA